MSNLSKTGASLQVMYSAKTNSPSSELANSINDSQSTIELVDASVLPDAPNLLTIGEDEDAETCVYNEINGNVVNILMRGFQGGSKSWDAGTSVARNFTAYDHNTFKQNFNSLGSSAVEDLSSDGGVVSEVLGQNRLVTVGSGGTYATLQEAFDAESVVVPAANVIITVKLLSGYDLTTTTTHALVLTGGDYRHFVIEGTDSSHPYTDDRICFNFRDGCLAPVIDVLIDGQGQGNIGIQYVDSSSGVIKDGAGAINMEQGLIVNGNCNVVAQGANFSGCSNRGINVRQASMLNANNVDVTNCGNGLFVRAMGIVSANQTDASNAGSWGLNMGNGSIVFWNGTGTISVATNEITGAGIVIT